MSKENIKTIYWPGTDQKERESWYKDGKGHREDGPNYIEYDEAGKITKVDFNE